VEIRVAVKPILEVLQGTVQQSPPVWLMRQAGRYLPEYRSLRAKAGRFLDLCLRPELAAEATLQPIRRFGFDAAILFSDILLVPHALGQSVEYESGEGPRLEPIRDRRSIDRLCRGCDVTDRLEPVFEAVERIKPQLPASVALIGFCGAPWTVATYMVAGRGNEGQTEARRLALTDRESFGHLIDVLVAASSAFLIGQIKAGVDVVQIFDTWAGVLPEPEFRRWCMEPVRRICAEVRAVQPSARIIAFPRGAGTMLGHFLEHVPVNAISLDWTVAPTFACGCVPSSVAIQGCLDPVVLLAGGSVLDEEVDRILTCFSDRPFIFNLGHGIMPDTPIPHVEQMLRRIRAPRLD
jgi:uroporphyrinogen decarboxylase